MNGNAKSILMNFLKHSISSTRPSQPIRLKHEVEGSRPGTGNSFVREVRDGMGWRASHRIESPQRLDLRETTQAVVDLFTRTGEKAMNFPYNGALGRISEGFGGVLMSLPLNGGGKQMLELHIDGMGGVSSRPKVSDGEMTAILKLALMSIRQEIA
jgi:hypothetical protein